MIEGPMTCLNKANMLYGGGGGGCEAA